MARPNWEYIRVDVLFPDHPKIEGLSDKAFRALITLWCYCGSQRTDGYVTARQWEKWPKRIRAELLTAGLAHPLDIGGGCEMHDFTGHQRSRREIEDLSAAGKKAASARWHKGALPRCDPHASRICDPHAEPNAPPRMRSAMPRQWQRQRTNPCLTAGPVQAPVVNLRRLIKCSDGNCN